MGALAVTFQAAHMCSMNSILRCRQRLIGYASLIINAFTDAQDFAPHFPSSLF
jgi:hypothetical protein